MTKLFYRSRAFRIAANIVFNVFLVLASLIASNTLSNYTTTGNAVLLTVFILVAAWAWWYGEDRDRRAELKRRKQASSGDAS